MLLVEGKVTEVELQSPPGDTRTIRVRIGSSPDSDPHIDFESFSQAGRFENAVNARNMVFGDTEGGRIDPSLVNLVACSFPALLGSSNPAGRPIGDFSSSGGLDLSAHAERGGAVLFLLAKDHTPIPSTGLFETQLGQARTLYRIPLEIIETD